MKVGYASAAIKWRAEHEQIAAGEELHAVTPLEQMNVNRRPKRPPYRRPKETPFVGQRYDDDGRAVRAGCGVGRA